MRIATFALAAPWLNIDITNMAKGETLFEAWTSKRRGMPAVKMPAAAPAKQATKRAAMPAQCVVEAAAAPADVIDVVDVEPVPASQVSTVTPPSAASHVAIKPTAFPQAKRARALFVGSFQMNRSTALCLLVFYTAIVFLAFQAGQRATTSASPIVPPEAVSKPHSVAAPQAVSASPAAPPAASSAIKAMSSTSAPKATATSAGNSWDTLLREGKAPAKVAPASKHKGR